MMIFLNFAYKYYYKGKKRGCQCFFNKKYTDTEKRDPYAENFLTPVGDGALDVPSPIILSLYIKSRKYSDSF